MRKRLRRRIVLRPRRHVPRGGLRPLRPGEMLRRRRVPRGDGLLVASGRGGVGGARWGTYRPTLRDWEAPWAAPAVLRGRVR